MNEAGRLRPPRTVSGMGVAGDTIAAIATGAGQGGIAIVRISGPGAWRVGAEVLERRGGGPLPLEAGRSMVAWVWDRGTGRRVDEVLVLWMPGPASYTTEDVLEIQCHGGSVAASEVLGLALGAGARLAEPGEFTLRAFLGGRIDLLQAEAVLDVIRAETSEALRVHEGLLEGWLSREVESWQTALGGTLARLEADLDFPEEDLGTFDGERAMRELEDVGRALAGRLETYSRGRVAREGFRVALVGAPNVGKSSLLNRLAGEDRAIVSPIPGTTRDAIEIGVDAGGVPVTLVDTAGLRACVDELEAEGVRRARRVAGGADLVVLVCDGSRALTAEEEAEGRRLRAAGRALGVVNKADLGAAPARTLGEVLGREALRVSAVTGEGTGELLAAFREAAWGRAGPPGSGALTRQRHQEAVAAAAKCIGRAVEGLRRGGYAEVVAGEVQAARRHLDGLLGRGVGEDVLDAIFREFCIGK